MLSADFSNLHHPVPLSPREDPGSLPLAPLRHGAQLLPYDCRRTRLCQLQSHPHSGCNLHRGECQSLVSASTETVCGGGRIWPELAGWHPSISSHQEVSLGLEASVRAVSGQWDMCLVALASFPPPPPPCSRATAPLYVSREVEEDTVLKGIFSRQQSQKEGGFNTVGSLCLLCYALQPASTWCAG